MLDEQKQIELSKLVPVGVADLPIQLQYRQKIKEQQQQLHDLHRSAISKVQPIKEDFLAAFFADHQVKRYGVTAILPEFTFRHATINPTEEIAIVFAIPMSYDEMSTAPSYRSATEIMKVYSEVGAVVVALTAVLRQHGIQASGHHPMGNIHEYHHVLMPPHAQAAGLGEKGRTGLFIDHELGPLIRLGMVTTSYAFTTNQPVDMGLNVFCQRCVYCVKYCPPKALPEERNLDNLIEGAKIQFKIDGDRCIKYFAKHFGCGNCMVNCVLTQPNPEAIAIRMSRINTWYHKWVLSGEFEKLKAEHGLV